MSWQSAHFISSQSFIDANFTPWLPVVKTEILKKIIILFLRIKKTELLLEKFVLRECSVHIPTYTRVQSWNLEEYVLFLLFKSIFSVNRDDDKL